MGIHKELVDIYEYLLSVRKLEKYLSIDIEFPTTWKLPKKYVSEDRVVEINSTDNSKRCFSFISDFNDKALDLTTNSIKNIILYNKEIELKERLLQQKINELKNIFQTQDLNNLKSLKFDYLNENFDDGEETINTGGETPGMVEERD
jgi:hypothetical protein